MRNRLEQVLHLTTVGTNLDDDIKELIMTNGLR